MKSNQIKQAFESVKPIAILLTVFFMPLLVSRFAERVTRSLCMLP